MSVTKGFSAATGVAKNFFSKLLGSPALGAVAAIMAAFTDNASYHRFYNAAAIWTANTAVKLTATVTGTAADVKNIALTIVGTDAAGAPLTETLPAFTLNTLGSVTSVNAFKTVTSITIPAHDGTGVSTSVGVLNGGAAAVLAAWVDKGVQSIIKTATINNPAVPRNVTATAAGTGADVAAIAPIVYGLDQDGVSINETLPAFTVNTPGDVTGNKAFASITMIDLPIHDGTGATTSFGTGAKLGVGERLNRNSIFAAYLNGVREATAPTVTFDPVNMSGNTVTLNSALNGTPVIIDFID